VVERALAVVGLAGAILVALALTGALQHPAVPGATASQYCPTDQYGNQYGDCTEDTIAPLIGSVVTPGPNDNGWNNTNVTLIFNATDDLGGTGVRSITCNLGGTTNGSTRGIVFTAATVNTVVSCTAMDWAGNVSDPASKHIQIDKVRPSIGLATRTPAADLYGWNYTDVTVTWPCSDAFSGPVTPSVSRTLATNGQFQTATGTCIDLAGNQTSATFGGINIDKTVTTPTGGPPNDNIAAAGVVPGLPFSDSIDTTTATRETHEPTCTQPSDDHTLWYQFTAAQSGVVRVSLTGDVPTSPVISVWRPSTLGLSLVSCRPASQNTFTEQPGVTYYIRIGSIGSGAGPFTVSLAAVPPPPNDAFANATPVGTLPFSDSLDLSAATTQAGEPIHPSGSLSALTRTAWYRYTAPQTERIVVGGTTTLSAVSVLTVYTGSSLANLSQLASSSQIFFGGSFFYLAPLVFQATAGTTYYIQAGTFVFPSGAADLSTIGFDRPIMYVGQTPQPNANGWNNGSVTLAWLCSPLLPLTPPNANQVLFFEGRNQAETGTCFSPFGFAVSDTEGGINIDTTPPNAPTALPDRLADYAGGGGWYTDVVTVGFHDNGDPNGSAASGVDPASIPASVTFSTEGLHTASGTVKDLAGNESASGGIGVQVDATPPDLSATFANADGSAYVPGTWTNQAVTVTFQCSDGGSGVASLTPQQTISTEGANQSVTGTCSDNVGHQTTQAFGGIDIDLTPPEAYLAFDPTSRDVQLFGRDQGGSGVATANPVTPTTASGNGSAQTRTYTVLDGAGNRLVLVLQAKPGAGLLQATVTSLRYNAGSPIVAPFTSLTYDWATNRDGSLKSLDQDLTIGKGPAQRHVVASYDASKNQTKLTDASGTSTRTGLVLVRVASAAGALSFEY
jgi:hypothetical protein